jgi:uncharacterized protein YoxC
MEIILYIAGGIALLALAWLLYSLTNTLKVLQKVMIDAMQDVHEFTRDMHTMTEQVAPILENVRSLTVKTNSIVDGVQSQIVSIQSTVDDTLDVVRGTIDDIERLKNEVVDIVEAPLRSARGVSTGVASVVLKGAGLLVNLFGNRKNGKH